MRERKRLRQQISDTLIKPRYFSLHLPGGFMIVITTKISFWARRN